MWYQVEQVHASLTSDELTRHGDETGHGRGLVAAWSSLVASRRPCQGLQTGEDMIAQALPAQSSALPSLGGLRVALEICATGRRDPQDTIRPALRTSRLIDLGGSWDELILGRVRGLEEILIVEHLLRA